MARRMHDEISKPRKLAIAKRCQLIIGSFDDSPYNCPCESKSDCKLTNVEIEEFSENPEIMKVIKRNLAEFNRNNHE